MLTGKGCRRRDWKGSMKVFELVSADFPEEAASEKLKGSFSSDMLSLYPWQPLVYACDQLVAVDLLISLCLRPALASSFCSSEVW